MVRTILSSILLFESRALPFPLLSSSSSSSSIISRFFRLRLVFACSLFFEKRKEKTREGIESNRRKYGAAWKRPFIRVTRRFLAELSRDLRAVVPFPRRSGPRIMYIYIHVYYTHAHTQDTCSQRRRWPPPPVPSPSADICRKLNKERSPPLPPFRGPLNILNRLNNRRLPSLALAHADNDASPSPPWGEGTIHRGSFFSYSNAPPLTLQ